MKAVLFISPLCEHAKSTSRTFKKVMSEKSFPHDVVNQNNEEGSLYSQCYGIKETPALLFIREDGTVAEEIHRKSFYGHDFAALLKKYKK